MRLQLNFKSGIPVYLQIVDQVRLAVAAGALRPGEALPSIRPLAEELRVNRNTVAKAYAELERSGVVETLPGKGCFVRAPATPLRKEARVRLLAEALDDVVARAHHLQIDRADFLGLAEERFEILQHRRERAEAAVRS